LKWWVPAEIGSIQAIAFSVISNQHQESISKYGREIKPRDLKLGVGVGNNLILGVTWASKPLGINGQPGAAFIESEDIVHMGFFYSI
jgi:hypothetical protein